MNQSENKLISSNSIHLIFLKENSKGEKIIVKQLNSAFPDDEQIAQLKNEYISSHKYNIKGLRKSKVFSESQGNYFLELEYIEGESLKELVAKNKLELFDAINVFIKVCDVLIDIHKAGWIHCSIGSSNIIVNPDTKEPTIIDSSLMTKHTVKASNSIVVDRLKSILPYVSPEQTGRTNKMLDHRTDLYTLGVSMYETVTQELPFKSNDTLELIYSHLATIPAEASKLNTEVPNILSKIISKLLAKNAEERYQSAMGLKYDLERLIEHWDNRFQLDYTLGEKDFIGKLKVPQKLYGRNQAVETLLHNLNLTLNGDLKSVLITGESGTGKTAVVQEVLKPVIEKKGYFLNGKFDQFARNIPYSAWIEIFKDFVNQILIADELEIEKWKYILQHTLGNSVGVLVDLIPNLKHIIHNIPEAEQLGVTETHNRLNSVLNLFFKSISSSEHPVIIFLDDVQWADNASLNLMKSLLTDANCNYLYLIIAYRNDEFVEKVNLELKIAEIEQIGFKFENINLGNLKFEELQELIEDTLSINNQESIEVTKAIFNKTQGNPYFTYQFIQAISDEELISFNWAKSMELKKPIWNIDLLNIHAKFISHNVVDFLLSKINELNSEVIQVLKSASCIGNVFSLKQLSTVLKISNENALSLLDNAVNEGYILYKNYNQVHLLNNNIDVEFQFSHDRVQQTFYSLIPENDKQVTHYEIGKLLYDSLQAELIYEHIFQLVFHLNFGVNLVQDYNEKKWLAELNLIAGNEAIKIIAFDSAYDHYSIAKKLVGEEAWAQDSEFALEIGHKYLNSAFLSNNIDEAESYFEFLINKIDDNVKKAELYFMKMIQYQHLSKIDNILDTGLKGLDLLGMKFSVKSSKFSVLVELIKTYWLIRGKKDDELKNIKPMEDPKSKIAMSLIFKTLTFAYDRSEELMGVLGLKLLQLTIKKGNHEASIAGFSTYAGILSIGFNQNKTAYNLNKLAIYNAEKTKNKASISMAHFGMGMTTYSPYESSLIEFQKSFDIAVEGGMYTDAAPSTMYFFFLNFLKGKRNSELKQIVLDKLYFTHQIKTENFHLVLLACLACLQELSEGEDKDIVSISDKRISSNELEQMLISTEHKSIRIYSRIFQMQNHLLFDRLEKALLCEQEILKGLNVTLGTVLGPYFQLLRAILSIKLFDKCNEKEKSKRKKVIAAAKSKIAKFNLSCPSNYETWNLLINAIHCQVNQQNNKAQKYYDQCIDLSKQNNNVFHASFATLLCSDFNTSLGNSKISEFYRSESVLSFRAWGAEAIALKQIEKQKSVLAKVSLTNVNNSISLDQDTLFKFSQLISGEIDFVKLIKKLMTVFIENAGAVKAVLISKDQAQWYIEAVQNKDEEIVFERELIAFDKFSKVMNPLVSKNICQYVIRTKETVIIDDAYSDNRINKDDYSDSKIPRSILCLPLIKKGELEGLVYLENNAMSGVFKPDRVQLLNYISSQIAISIDNAKLYLDLKQLNKSYERFVPKEFLEILGKNSITDVHLGDQVQMDMSVMFADIRNFTGRSEQMTPSENFEFINDYLKRMEPIIHKYNGFIDKYIGDEIMALFPSSADDAVQCGIAMLHELNVYGAILKTQGKEPINIGIGLNTGNLMLGTVGGEDRMNSSVISDAVNLASRVEKDTKSAGASFLITDETYQKLKQKELYSIRKIGNKKYRGKSTKTTVYEVFDSDEMNVKKLKIKTLNQFEQAVDFIDLEQFDKAIELFEQIIKINPQDEPTKLILQNLKELDFNLNTKKLTNQTL